MKPQALETGRRIIAFHSKSFALASRLLPQPARDRAVVVYAWCRRADDTVDVAGPGQRQSALAALERDLERIYAGSRLDDPILDAFQQVTQQCRIPRHYPQELLAGLEMDLHGARYDTLPALLLYCYRVAGTVGLMMCHVLGVHDEEATRNAVHLGVAMQITNICRDVAEDWGRGRLYLPTELLRVHGGAGLEGALGGPFPPTAREPVARVTEALLRVAEAYYRSGDAGIPALSWRCGVGVRTARRVYAAIGTRIRSQGCAPLAGRAIVPGSTKLVLAAGAVLESLRHAIAPRQGRRAPLSPPSRVVRAEDVLPLGNEPLARHDGEASLPEGRTGRQSSRGW
ncbi:MAG TPA: phytoene/squalene synthase family protein [Candidatus Krumholzibacteria bacterium]|nr:phytoene/squalene synthase family protein [Candidatus Krumholzibacteria bacterium]